MLLLSLSAEMTLIHLPQVRGVLPPGGLLGTVLAEGLRAPLNPVGANLVSVVLILTSLFLTTSFSLRTAAHWLRAPMSTDGIFGKWMARVADWREERESSRLRKRVEEIKIAGRPPVAQQRVSTKELPLLEDVHEPGEDIEDEDSRHAPTVIKIHELEKPAPPKKTGAEPKISRGKTTYKLPPSSLLQMAERGQKMDESELKECARAIEQKCAEFDVAGRITQINPGPVVTTFELKPEAGIKYSRITGLGDDLCLALKAESILIERIPGKSTVGIEVPNVHRETIALRDVVESPEFSHSPSKLTLPFGKDLIG